MSEDLSGFSMMDLFRMEAETHTAALTEGLLELEENPAATEEIEGMMRAAHSLKGAARIVNLDPAVNVAHAMEDCFVAVQEGKLTFDEEDIDVLLRGLDLLKSISETPDEEITARLEERSAEIRATVDDLESILDPGRKTAAPKTPTLEPSEEEPSGQASSTTRKPEKPEKPEKPRSPTGTDRPPSSAQQTVRVTSENLSRLMELAAESLVEARRLEPITTGFRQLASSQLNIDAALSALRERLAPEETTNGNGDLLGPLVQELTAQRAAFEDRLKDLENFLRRTTDLSGHLYHEVLSSRLRPFQDGVVAFPRMVRDLAKDLGKKGRFSVRGKATPVDRDILEKLDAPLNHMVRNALDHGMETPEERIANGKEPEGQLVLEAHHRDGMLSITISDDGRGINLESLRRKVVERKLTSEDMARAMGEHELLDFLFLPAFSTADQVTAVSGRGVGLDVVQTLMQELGGKHRITTTPGKGTTFHLLLPISRSVIRALLVEISGELYAIPLSRADRVLRLSLEEKCMAEGRDYVHLEGDNVGLLSAHEVLELPPPESTNEELCILVVSDGQNRYGLEVDQFVGEQDLVVRPLDPRLGKVPDISATAVGDDGTPILIIDVDDLVRSIDRLLASGHLARLRREGRGTQEQEHAARRVLVVDDSITVREMQRQLLESRGYVVDTAVDGMEGWNAVRLGQYELVVSDVDMPRMTGIELIELIRKEERLRELPVIIVSYKDREEDRLRGLHAGANYYLTKSSFQDDTYLNTVEDLIGPAKS